MQRIALALLLSLSTAFAFSQAQKAPAPAYEPQVGQEGKDVVWVPTPQALVDKMLDMAKVTPQDYVMDLGSGDGRTVITAAKRGARAMGVEYNPEMVELSRKNAIAAGVGERATFVKADLFETDFSQATVITMFLLPQINVKLRPKILDLRPGTRVVSNTFTMEDWETDATETVGADCQTWCTALFWIVPAKVGGTWRLPQGELRLTQNYQMVSGTLTAGGQLTPVTGKLRGDQLTLTAGTQEYSGVVRGNAIEGTLRASSGTTPWRAARAAN